MLRCRNYIEETMFRPRVMESTAPSNAIDAKGRRQARATGAKNHMFVRVGRLSDTEDADNLEAEKRSVQMRGSFVRIGRQMSDQAVGDDSRLLEGQCVKILRAFRSRWAKWFNATKFHSTLFNENELFTPLVS
jgi:hypothetical protein